MIDVTISRYWLKKCELFALQCAETNLGHYKTRGQSAIDKIVSDIYTGRMGEVAVYLHKKSLGISCSKPDFKIYRGRQKSYDADLRSENRKLHVKTQSLNSATKYGTSWILQCRPPNDKDKLFKKRDEDDFAVLCVIKNESEVTILAEVQVDWLFSMNLIKDPTLKWFLGVKKAIYWTDVSAALDGQKAA